MHVNKYSKYAVFSAPLPSNPTEQYADYFGKLSKCLHILWHYRLKVASEVNLVYWARAILSLAGSWGRGI